MLTRRTFLKALAVGAAGLALPLDAAEALVAPERRLWALDGTMLGAETPRLVACDGDGWHTLAVPSPARFRPHDVIKLDDELMLVTAVGGGTLTVTCGLFGTVPRPHTSGVAPLPLGPAVPELFAHPAPAGPRSIVG
jgi:hypothetical protein